MGKASTILVAFVVLLALANADARFVQLDSSENATPFNLSGNSASPQNLSGNSASPFDLSGNSPSPQNLSGNSGSPFDLSGNSPSPQNLSGNSATPFNLSGNAASPQNLSGNSVAESALGFNVWNNMASPIEMNCWGADDEESAPQTYLVSTTMQPLQHESYDINVIDPSSQHALYKCNVRVTDTASTRCMEQVVAAAPDYWHICPNCRKWWHICPNCRDFSVLDDGIYLQNAAPVDNTFVKIQGWNAC